MARQPNLRTTEDQTILSGPCVQGRAVGGGSGSAQELTAAQQRALLKRDGIDATGFLGNLTTAQFNASSFPATGQWGFNVDHRGAIWRYNGTVWVPDKYGVIERPSDWWTSHDYLTAGATGPDGWSYSVAGSPTVANAEITSSGGIRINTSVPAGASVSISKTFSLYPLDIYEISELFCKWYLDAYAVSLGAADGDICCSVKFETGLGDFFEAIYYVRSDDTEYLKLSRDIGAEGLLNTAGTPEQWISSSGYDETYGVLIFDSIDNISFLHGDRAGQGQNDEESTDTSYRFTEGTSSVTVSYNVFSAPEVTSSTRSVDVIFHHLFLKMKP